MTGGRAGGRAGGVRTLLQPARAQCLRLSERFFHINISININNNINININTYYFRYLFVPDGLPEKSL